jgi:hypothetical protein
MIDRRRALVSSALALALMAACNKPTEPPNGNPGAGTRLDSKATRLARDVAELQESTSRMEALGLHEPVLEAVARILGEGDGETWRRSGGWAFRTFELAYWTAWGAPQGGDPGAPMFALDFRREDHPYHTILRYARTLESHGIDFLVVPVPLRTQVYPERLDGIPDQGPDFRGIDLAHAKYLLTLAQAGVEVLDLLPRFAAQRFENPATADEFLYHAFDRHWTPRGAAIAAGAIAERIRQYPWFSAGELREGTDFVLKRERTSWTPRRKPGLPESEQSLEIWLTQVLRPADGEAAQQSDRSSPIVILGDSFLNHFHEEAGGVDSLLLAQLKMPLDTIALPGGSSVAVWQALGRRGDKLAGKKLVVWLSSTDQLADPRLRFIDLFED